MPTKQEREEAIPFETPKIHLKTLIKSTVFEHQSYYDQIQYNC